MKTETQILSALQKEGPLSVLQLSQKIGLTKAAIRYQLGHLLNRGAIYPVSSSNQSGAGRPSTRFKLNASPNPRLLKLLIQVLSNELLERNEENQNIEKSAESIALGLLATGDSTGNSKAVRINRQVENLRLLGFVIHWEVTQSGPAIFFETEPLSAVIPNANLVSAILTALTARIT